MLGHLGFGCISVWFISGSSTQERQASRAANPKPKFQNMLPNEAATAAERLMLGPFASKFLRLVILGSDLLCPPHPPLSLLISSGLCLSSATFKRRGKAVNK